MIIPVDPYYNPNLQIVISSATKLAPGITCAKFLGSRGSGTQFEKLYNEDFTGEADRRQIARNLYLHAQAMRSIIDVPAFRYHRLIVSEGVYEPTPQFEYEIGDTTKRITRSLSYEEEQALATQLADPEQYEQVIAQLESQTETIEVKNTLIAEYVGEKPTGINALKRTGQAIVYQLINRDGVTDESKTFDLAVYWKDYIDYDKLILDYDTYDISGRLTSQIVLQMPNVPHSFNVSFSKQVETRFNGELQSKADLVEILAS